MPGVEKRQMTAIKGQMGAEMGKRGSPPFSIGLAGVLRSSTHYPLSACHIIRQ